MSNATVNVPILTIDITGKNEDLLILQLLSKFRKRYTEIRETAYMKDFDALRTFNDKRDPKFIIQDTLIIYERNACDISKQRNLLKVYLFKYSDDDNTHFFKYSNDMLFSDDITILCFLYYCVSRDSKSNNCETVQILMSLMNNKYGMDIEGEMQENNTESTQEQNKIKLHDVANSYPSITWDMSTDIDTCVTWFNKFSDFKVPKRIFLNPIVFLLPKLNRDPPYAILLLTALKLCEHNNLDINNYSLYTIFTEIYANLVRPIFPQRLKLELCLKWKIVEKGKVMYQYSACFEEYRQKAKDLIAEIKPNDPDLKSILSRRL